MDYLEIEKVIGREIIDSRGNPTVEAAVKGADILDFRRMKKVEFGKNRIEKEIHENHSQ